MRTGRLLLAGGTVVVLAITGVSDSVGTASVGTARALAPAESIVSSPYDGTAAEHFAVGAAGVVMPPAQSVPDGYLVNQPLVTRDITAGEVAQALADVRAALIASRLDRRMLVDHDPDPFIRTLARLYWDTWFDPQLPSVGLDFEELPDAAALATMLAPDARLVAEPRVAGWITYGPATTDRGVPAIETQPWWILEIATRFVWVYAFEVPESESGTGIVVVKNEVVWYAPTDYRLSCCRANLGLHYAEAEARAWGADCELYEAHGLIRSGGPGQSPAITEAVFDVDRPLVWTAGCRHRS